MDCHQAHSIFHSVWSRWGRYLARRVLDDEAILWRLSIGFSDRSRGLRLLRKRRPDGADIPTWLTSL